MLRFLPPLVIGEDLLNEGLDIIEQAFARSERHRIVLDRRSRTVPRPFTAGFRGWGGERRSV